ncbi:MAG: hypothetical protein JNM72_06320 [Deltaproteobacteria bacterium]|nr:hypothetical protein [Deltaproteobacteria bacterium]
MAGPWAEALAALGERADEELIPRLLQRLSLRTETEQRLLGLRGLRYVGDGGGEANLDELRAASAAVLRGALDRAGARGALLGLAGALSLPADAGAAVVQRLHLAQRLMVVWGHPLEGDAGVVMLRRLLRAADGEEAPAEGQLSLRVRDVLPLSRSGGAPSLRAAARALVGGLQRAVGAELLRALPGVGAGASGRAARLDTGEAGTRMIAVLERIYGLDSDARQAPVEAELV